MKLNVKKNLTNGVFSVRVDFKDYEVFEEGLIEDFGTAELVIPVSTYQSKIEDSTGKLVVSEVGKTVASNNCKIDITTEIVAKLDDTFKLEYSVKVADIEEEHLSSPVDTVVKMAEAKCATFVKLIEKEAKAQMDKLRSMKTDFEAAVKNPETIRV